MSSGSQQSLSIRPLRIAYVVPAYSPHIGGVETHVARLARCVVARGHYAEVITQERDGALPAMEIIDGVTVRRFPLLAPSRNFAVSPRLYHYLARRPARFDLIHAHGYHALPALAAALTSRLPLVFTPHYHGTGHSPLRSLLHKPYRLLGARIFARAACVICVSGAEAALVRKHFPRVGSRLTVIPNGIDVQAIRAAKPYLTESTIVLSVGRLESYKQVDHVLGAMRHLDKRFVLKVIGAGPEQTALEARATDLGLAERVEFLGRVSDEALHRWYRTAAVYVTCSTQEAFGMAALEALAAGAGVVASDIPAHRELAVGRESTAISLLPGTSSAADIGLAIARMAGRRPDAHVVVEIVDWEKVAEATLRVYREVAAGAV